jgi:hypothetical protein
VQLRIVGDPYRTLKSNRSTVRYESQQQRPKIDHASRCPAGLILKDRLFLVTATYERSRYKNEEKEGNNLLGLGSQAWKVLGCFSFCSFSNLHLARGTAVIR